MGTNGTNGINGCGVAVTLDAYAKLAARGFILAAIYRHSATVGYGEKDLMNTLSDAYAMTFGEGLFPAAQATEVTAALAAGAAEAAAGASA